MRKSLFLFNLILFVSKEKGGKITPKPFHLTVEGDWQPSHPKT